MIYITTSGVFAAHFYGSSDSAQINSALVPIENSSFESFKRSINSFASVCFASIFVSILSFCKPKICNGKTEIKTNIENVGNDAKSKADEESNNYKNEKCGHSYISIIFGYILGVSADVIPYCNSYTFSHVAVYGKDYITAAKGILRIFDEQELHMLTNDQLLPMTLSIAGLYIGIINFSIILPVSLMINASISLIPVFAALIIGVAQFWLFATVIDSGIKTSIVCLAEDPESVAKTAPELYQKVKELYPDAKLK